MTASYLLRLIALGEIILAGVFLSLSCLALHGYSFATNGYHGQFLPHLFKLLRPELYPGDAFVATLDLVPTLFWKMTAGLCKVTKLSPQTTNAVMFSLVSTATWSAIYQLGRTISSTRRGAIAGCAFAVFCPYLFQASLFSTDMFLRTTLDATSFSLPFALFGLCAALAEHPAAAGGLLGFIVWFQPLHSLSYGLIAALALAPRKHQLRRFALAYLLFVLPAFPVFFMRPPTAIASHDWADLMRLWYPWHYFPQWPWQQMAHIAAQGLLLGTIVLAVPRTPETKRALSLAKTALCVVIVAALLVKTWPWRPLASLQLMRLDGLIQLILLLIAGTLFDREIADSHDLLYCAIAVSALCEPFRLVFPAACAGLLFASRRAGEKWKRPAAGFVLLASLGVLTGLIPLAYHLNSTIPIAVFSLILIFPAKAPISQIIPEKRLLSCALAVALLLSLRDLSRVNEIRKKGWLGPYPDNFHAAQAWVKEHSPINALVLCFPTSPGMRVGFERSMVGEWLDGSALNWAPDFGPGWKQRMDDIGFRLSQIPDNQLTEQLNLYPVLNRSYPNLPILTPWDAPRLKNLLDRYHPDIVVTPFAVSLPDIQAVYQSGPFLVYQVKKRPNRATSPCPVSRPRRKLSADLRKLREPALPMKRLARRSAV